MSKWTTYERKGDVDIREPLQTEIRGGLKDDRISISDEDLENGSPKVGDRIARNKDNHDDKWLIAADFFNKNYKEKGNKKLDLVVGQAKRVCKRELSITEEPNFADEHEYLLELIEDYEKTK